MCSALAGRSVAGIQSQDFPGDCPAALCYQPLSSSATCCLLCLPSWIWASSLHFCWLCLFVLSFLFSEQLASLQVFSRKERQCALIYILRGEFHWKKNGNTLPFVSLIRTEVLHCCFIPSPMSANARIQMSVPRGRSKCLGMWWCM